MYIFAHPTTKADLYLYVRPRSAIANWAWNEVTGHADPGAIVTARLTDGAAQPVVLEAIDAKADGSGFKVQQTSGRDLDLGPELKFRVVIKADMTELYVNDYLMNLKRVRCNGQIGFMDAGNEGKTNDGWHPLTSIDVK